MHITLLCICNTDERDKIVGLLSNTLTKKYIISTSNLTFLQYFDLSIKKFKRSSKYFLYKKDFLNNLRKYLLGK